MLACFFSDKVFLSLQLVMLWAFCWGPHLFGPWHMHIYIYIWYMEPRHCLKAFAKLVDKKPGNFCQTSLQDDPGIRGGISHHMDVSKNNGTPKWMVKIMVPNPMFLLGAQPSPCCSFARHLVAKRSSVAHLLITKHSPGFNGWFGGKTTPIFGSTPIYWYWNIWQQICSS